MRKELNKNLVFLILILSFALLIFVISRFNYVNNIISEEVNYYEDVNGYLAKPQKEGNYPGVIMIHEWWGLNDNIKRMADSLAAEGYIVLAVDLYHGQIATDSSEAGKLAGAVRQNSSEAIDNMRASISYLKAQGAEKIASLGWCFGGGQSLQISLNEDLDATVIYYGNLITNKTELSAIKSPVLGIFGSEDESIPILTVDKFNSSLSELGIKKEIYVYDGVGHAFANPSGDNYAPEETKDAWLKTLFFLEENLKE